jgi:hypothetical protein
MTPDKIKKVKQKILNDGSLAEEKKEELLNLLATMNPEWVKAFTNQFAPISKSRIMHV